MGFTRPINPNSTDSHQASPAYLLTFLRWSNRDTENYTEIKALDVRIPLVVYNDALQVVVTHQKSQMSPTATMVLKGGDINYATAISPGDHVLINMVNWEKDAERLRDRAVDLQSINEYDDGFKGSFKVQSVVKSVSVDRETGIKVVNYTITAAGFTEFNNVISYNPTIAAAWRQAGVSLYQNQIGDSFAPSLKAYPNVQNIMRILFKSLIGQSLKKQDIKEFNYGNTHFKVPATLGKLMGIQDARFACDMNNYIIGVWKDSVDTKGKSVISPKVGFNPSFKLHKGDKNYYDTGIALQGSKQVNLEDWNDKTAWSILQGYMNSTMNEMYSCYRVSPDTGRVVPTVVVRQKPFTSEHFYAKTKYRPVTRFMQLPTWKVSANLMYELQTSKNDSFRYNFVQVFTHGQPGALNSPELQIKLGNFVYDNGDITRNGLRPYIVQAPFNYLSEKNPAALAVPWANIVSDWLLEGHLKEAGTMTFQGLQEPICVGDNIEFDGVVYHIESIVHSMSINQGRKSFLTKLTVTYGMDMRSSKKGPVYPNMEHTDAQTNNHEDWNHERILPGVSDTQNIRGRVDGEEVKDTKQISFTPSRLRKKRAPSGRNDGGNSK